MTSSSDTRRSVLLLMHSPAYVRNFESVLRALAVAGHRIVVLFEKRKEGGDRAGLALIDRLCSEYPGLSNEFLVELPLGVRGRLRLALQAGQDYLRYFDAPYHDAIRLRSRALAFLPSGLEHALAATIRRWPRVRGALASAARRFDGWLGEDRCVRGELERRQADALIVTPMVQFGSRQSDWVRAARGLGIGTMVCVHSWDNLTTKGLMHALPDRVAVWNDAQRRQAIELHGVRHESIVVTGAWPYDHWVDWRVSRSRAALCRELGLPEERAIILYVCSSRFIAEGERAAVARWVGLLRACEDPRVATASVIIRPHPLNADEWSDPSLGELPGVVVFPPGGADPVDDASRADYFDSIAHADAVVGVNTSALIESAIVDRPALALPAPEFRSSQEELPHFRQLVGDPGMLTVSVSVAEHLGELSRTLADASAGAARRGRFVETFIRPNGGGPSPTERLVAAVDALLDSSGPDGPERVSGAATMHA